MNRLSPVAGGAALLRPARSVSLQRFAVGDGSWHFALMFAFPDVDNALCQVEFVASDLLVADLEGCGEVYDGGVGLQSTSVDDEQGDERGEFTQDRDGILPHVMVYVEVLQNVGECVPPVFAGLQVERDVFGREFLYGIGVEFFEDCGIDPFV